MSHSNRSSTGESSGGETDPARNSVDRLAAIFSRAAVGLSEISLDGHFQEVNEELCRLVGRSREWLLSAKVEDITHPDDLQLSLSAFQRAIETGEAVSLDKRYSRPDGSLIYANSILTRLDDEQGRPNAVLVVTVDLTERKRRELNSAFLSEIHADFTRLSCPEEIMAEAARKICHYLAVTSVSFADIEETEQRATVVHQFHEDGTPRQIGDYPLTDFMGETYLDTLKAGRTVAIRSIEADPRTVEFASRYGPYQIASLIHAPFVSDGGWRFLLAVHHREIRDWRADEIELVRELSARLGLRLERARAEESSKALHLQLETELADMQRLQETSTQLIAEGNANDLLIKILDTAIAFCRTDIGTLQLIDARSKQLHLLASRGFPPETTRHFERLPRWDQDTACEVALANGQRVIVPNLSSSPIFAGKPSGELLRSAGIAATQSTPLISRSGKLLGMLSTHWRQTRQPAQRELRLLDLLARQAADLIERHQAEDALRESERSLRELSRSLEKSVALRTAELQEQTVRLRHLAAELTSAEQRERKRLAALLHDDLQQLLAAANMRILMIRKRVGDPDVLRATEDAAKWIAEAGETTRNLTRQLRPPALYEEGLVAAVTWLASELWKRHALTVHIHADGHGRKLDDDGRALLFECVRELLFNVAKYAGVNEAEVSVKETDHELSLTVSDSGCGFKAQAIGASRPKGGFGLFSIQERVSALGGNMRIETALGNGVKIELKVPLKREGSTGDAGAKEAPLNSTNEQPRQVDPREQIRVLIVDDHTLVCQGIAYILNSHRQINVTAQAADGEAAIEEIQRERPDVVLMNIHMSGMSGIAATDQIHRRWPGITIIGLSDGGDETITRAMREAGASGFLAKSGDVDDVISMIRRVVGQAPKTGNQAIS